MTIKVGDRVRTAIDNEGEVLAIAGNEAAVLLGGDFGLCVEYLDELTPIAPEPEPAPLTGAQVAQVLEAVATVFAETENSSFAQYVYHRLRRQAERERDRG